MPDTATDEQQKADAIATHSRQADEFAHSYEVPDPYADCFNYSRHRLDAIITPFLSPEGRALRLLDVGCGTGHYMQRLAGRGYEVAGIDGSEEMLRYARENNPSAELRQGDVESLPFADGSFDVVIAIEVLRYLPDASKCIREMGRVLKPGGVCLATSSPLFSLNGYPIVNRLAAKIPLPNFVRLKQFFSTSGRLRRQFADAGFGSVGVHGVYFGPVNWFERLIPKWTPALLRRWEPVDRALADAPIAREMSNMFLVRAVKR